MNPLRILRILAVSNVLGGVAFLAWNLVGLQALRKAPEDNFTGSFLMLGVISALVAVFFAYVGARYLMQPTRKRGLRLAASSSVIVWFLLSFLLPVSLELTGMIGMMVLYLAILCAAFAVHRLYLRPIARKAFPTDEAKTA